MLKKITCFGLSVLMGVSVFSSAVCAADDSYILIVSENKGGSYSQYIDSHSDKTADVDKSSFSVDIFTEVSGNARFDEETYEGKRVLVTEEDSCVSGKINVSKSGLYRIGVRYIAGIESNVEIFRRLHIDGEVPFEEAASLQFSRVWKNETEIQQDSKGNDLFQSQIQLESSQLNMLHDGDYYYDEPYLFYLAEGEHTISFTAVQGTIAIEEIILEPQKKLQSYAEALDGYKKNGLSEVKGDSTVKVQAEDMTVKSSAMLSAVSDRGSASLEPAVDNTVKLNILGGGRFSKAGQWVEYVLPDVKEEGLYRLVFKVKQDASKGAKVARNIYINGFLPFAEAKNFEIEYTSSYKNLIFGDGENAYLVHLKKGDNTIRIEATLGEISSFCRRVEESLDVLNDAYRKLVTVTGTSPDVNRDYDVQDKLPDVVETFGKQAATLKQISNDITAAFDKTSSYTAVLESAVVLLERMYDDPYIIPSYVASLSSNLSSLGSLVSDMKKTDISMDYIMAVGADTDVPKVDGNFFRNVAFTVSQLLYSFVSDYNVLDNSDAEKNISAWIISGQDQTKILKQIIDSDFTPESQIGVQLRLVSDVKTLLQATLANVGPDVALNIPQGDVMNFAYRGALADMNEFEGIEEVKSRFMSSNFDTVTYKGHLYGIPQTCTYPMLFYRKDILDELKLSVPETWDDVYKILPVLTQNNMSFGLQTSDITNGSKAGVTSYGMLLYQRGGAFYDQEVKNSIFDSDLAVDTMRDWTELYSGYGMPVSYNFANRFASGEMPLAIADYSTSFNTLVMFAPQIANLWGFTQVPGTVKENGEIDHTVPVTITAGIILNSASDKNSAWKFMEWWSSDEVQSEFGTFLETLLGAAGRYATANTAVISKLSWSRLQYRNLELQMKSTVGIPEVAGGYFTWRYLDNAFREIIDDSTDVREVMYSCNKSINEEMLYQREALKLQ